MVAEHECHVSIVIAVDAHGYSQTVNLAAITADYWGAVAAVMANTAGVPHREPSGP
jgi:hypothetical protein